MWRGAIKRSQQMQTSKSQQDKQSAAQDPQQWTTWSHVTSPTNLTNNSTLYPLQQFNRTQIAYSLTKIAPLLYCRLCGDRCDFKRSSRRQTKFHKK
jgi:hypothetical protein